MRATQFLTACLLGLVLCHVVGCGPSKDDLIMRAAMRPRPTAANENKDEKPKQAKPDKSVAASPTRVEPAGPDKASAVNNPTPPTQEATLATNVGQEESGQTVSEEVVGTLLPIAERKPDQPLSDESRREWAYNGISKIADALTRYMADHPGALVPQARLDKTTGVKTLSWRVEMLPYLGYESLYEKFDLSKPWYAEPNKSLLKYIPDEFVSPERFDTLTNMQLPSARWFMFGERTRGRVSNVEDGMESTIMLVEVDDDHAVEWTAPEDYEPSSPEAIGSDIGGLRKDGTFAAWGNGWVTAIPANTSNQDLKFAFTAESGDRRVVSKLHKRVKIKKVTDGAVATAESSETVELSDDVVEEETLSDAQVASVEETVSFTRDALPSSSEISRSRERMLQIYAEKIKEAESDDDMRSLGIDLLKAASEISESPSDIVVLLKQAQQLGVDSANSELMIDAVDQYVGRFEVDPYEENMQAMLEFIAKTARRDPESIDSQEFLQRAVRVINAAISENDYMRASNLARHCAQFTARKSDDELRSKFNRLRGLLGGANNAFDDAKEFLANYRINPEDTASGVRFGQFLCFYKGDWENGLPLLKLSSNGDIANLAAADIKGGGTADEFVALGDSWWEMSRRASGVYRQGAQDRAVYWYNKALPIMPPSLDSMHVKHQLQEAENDETTSPIASCLAIADELNVDLGTSLAAVAAGVQAKQRGRSGEDRDRDRD